MAATGGFFRRIFSTPSKSASGAGGCRKRWPSSPSSIYQDQAQRALATLTVVAGFAVWAMVAALIIFLIFRIAFWYAAQLNALK